MLSNNLLKFLLVSLITILVSRQCTCKAIFGIGNRIIGDQLLLKDVQQSRPAGLTESPAISFNYAISEPITYIEIVSEENIYAEVNFSYQNNLVKGTVKPTNGTWTNKLNTTQAIAIPHTFEILITIYGYNDTMLNVNPAYILNRDQQFEGILQPHNIEDYLEGIEDENEYERNTRNHNNLDIDGIVAASDDDDDDDDNDDDAYFIASAFGDGDFEPKDKYIDIGHRQVGDYLIYETYQTSSQAKQEPTNHTVTFYYIDSNYITYVKFVIFDHFVDRLSTSVNYVPPSIEYTHYSPNTMKAVITEFNTTSLFVQMFMYGYEPKDLPLSYVPYLHSQQGKTNKNQANLPVTEAPLTALQRLRLLLNEASYIEGITTPSHLTTGAINAENDDENEQDAIMKSNEITMEQVNLTSRTIPNVTNNAVRNFYRFSLWSGWILLFIYIL